MIKIIFTIYNPKTDIVEVSLDNQIHIYFDCQKCNATVHLDESSDITYFTKLKMQEPGMYAKLTAMDSELQGYVEAMKKFN